MEQHTDQLKATIVSHWDQLHSSFPHENALLTVAQFQQASPAFTTQLAFSLIKNNAKQIGWTFVKSAKGALSLIAHAIATSDSFITDVTARQNVDYFMCSILFSSVPLARMEVISYYSSLKTRYNYDLIQQIADTSARSNGSESDMIELLSNLTVLFRYAPISTLRAIVATSDAFEYFEGIFKWTTNSTIRALFLNLLLKLSNSVKVEQILQTVYETEDVKSEAYFQSLLRDQQLVQSVFDALNAKYASIVSSASEQTDAIPSSSKSAARATTLANQDDDDDEFLVLKKVKVTQKAQLTQEVNISNDFVLTSSETTFMDEVKTTIFEHPFVVLDGPAGSGKTRMLNRIADDMNETIIALFIDSTTDLKSLVGSYVCTENIGSFEWRNGPLIKCMEEGMWLVLENLSEASEEILDGLIRCAHNGTYHLTSQGRLVHAHYKFRIVGLGSFGTSGKFEAKKQFLMSNCRGGYLTKPEMSEECLTSILSHRFPLSMRQPELIYAKIRSVFTFLRTDKSIAKKYSYFLHNLSADRMLKLFSRIEFHCKAIYGEQGICNNMLVTEMRRRIFLEIIESVVFAERFAVFDVKLVTFILETLELPLEEHQLSVLNYHPSIDVNPNEVKIGKLGSIQRSYFGKNLDEADAQKFGSTQNIIYNAYSSRLIEKIASCLAFNEPCLLVGDTGCGKTTMAQHVAEQFRKKLFIYNMNQGSDAIDLIGGFKPIDVRLLIKKILVKYVKHFEQVASLDQNKSFIDSLTRLYQAKNYGTLIKGMLSSIDGIKMKVMKKPNPETYMHKWNKIEDKLKNLYANKDKIESNLAFHFVEGNLIKAIKQGDWVLIDEINLASNEVLQKLLPIIEGKSLVLYEKGDLKEIKRHPMFRIIGCMNPGNEIGKKELPENVRGKFTEIYVHDIKERDDIVNLVTKKMGSLLSNETSSKIVDLFMQIKTESESNAQLEDGYNRKAHVSLRNLARSLNYIRANIGLYGPERAVYDGLYLGFGTALNKQSQLFFEKQLEKLLGVSTQTYFDSMLKSHVKCPPEALTIFGFLLNKGSLPVKKPEECEFLVTETFKKYIVDLLRAISNSDLPVLLEGPTSAGKTSMVKYIAELAGYKCVRVNNHHHTEIEEYIGTYLPDNKGRLVFHEGVLIEAMKQGHWLILDELNLARSEILESLNRLLDDNKELFINETQTYIRPHANFRIFATQNPTSYGGRKELSKAFKNRFVQIYFDDIGEKDLEQILQKRCTIAPSYCKRLMNILKDLKVFRQRNNFFLGKDGVITVRDLIKWGNREVKNLEELAMEGYCLLAERLRTSEERDFIQKVIEKHCKVKIDVTAFYENYSKQVLEPLMQQELPFYLQLNQGFKRMACLVLKSLVNNEPVLLIGETGCGKTTLAELVSFLRKSKLFSINCHQYTESSDFLGSLRPVRNKQANLEALEAFLNEAAIEDLEKRSKIFDSTISIDQRVKSLEGLLPEGADKDLESRIVAYETLFEWQDGPLVESMQQGGVFLIDEISLAEDSVLERLNSVLEPDRFLLLPEKSQSESIHAQDGFIIIATMNPGGDFGKRELSPALRNRFTEIWVEPLTNKSFLVTPSGRSDVVEMIQKFLTIKRVFNDETTRATIAENLFEFLRFYNVTFCERYSLDKKNLTMRDIVALMEFISRCQRNTKCSIQAVYKHALSMVVVEPIGFMQLAATEKSKMAIELNTFIDHQINDIAESNSSESSQETQCIATQSTLFTVGPFSYPIKPALKAIQLNKYSTSTAKTQSNLEKIMRALQLDKSILLEGMPGVGKSSMIEYISAMTSNKLTRISLSEQTDIVDLLGSDLPAPASKNDDGKSSAGSSGMKFKWFDGVLLDALKNGSWILLEELNLASQSILEGLNAILDHRGTVFIPEMNMSFTKHPDFRLFATQNPMSLGGGRKGLPASFMNRFTKIYVDEYSIEEQAVIINDLSTGIASNVLEGLARFAKAMEKQYFKSVNLRDLLRFEEVYQISKHDVQVAFEIAFGRVDADKYFTDLAATTTATATTSNTLPINYSYVDEHNEKILLLNSHRKALNHLSMMINGCSKHCSSFVLSGRSGSGKSQLVRLLSELHNGKRVVEFTLNSQTDSSELIGGYDQVDMKRQFSILNEKTVTELHRFISNITANARLLAQALKHLELLARLECSAHFNEKTLLVAVKEALDFIKNNSLPTEPNNTNNLLEIEGMFEVLRVRIVEAESARDVTQKKSQLQHTASNNGQFEWFYSEIIGAVRRGDWLVLDNVSRANQAVLARLNPLLDCTITNKRHIVITECPNTSENDSTTAAQSSPEICEIHPDFRVFFLSDAATTTTTSTGSGGAATDSSMNESIRNKCVQINVDALETAKFYGDLKAITELHFSNKDASHASVDYTEYITALPVAFIEQHLATTRVSTQLYSDFGTFVAYLKSIHASIAKNLLDLDMVNIIQTAFRKCYQPKAAKISLDIQSVIDAVPLPSAITPINNNTTIPAIIRDQFTRLSTSINRNLSFNALNLSAFPINRELHRFKGVGSALLSQSLTTSDVNAATTLGAQEAMDKAKLQETFAQVLVQQSFTEYIMNYIAGVDASVLRDIASRTHSSDALYMKLSEEFENIAQSRKVFAATHEFKKTKDFILQGFANALKQLKESNASANTATNNEATAVIQCAMMQAIRNVSALPKICTLIQQRIAEALSSIESQQEEGTSTMEIEGEKEKQASIAENLFVVLWRACQYFNKMPRSKEEFDTRAKVHYLVSSTSVSAVDFHEDLQAMVEMRANFRNMYYLENTKTRLTAMEVLALIYNNNNNNNTLNNSDSSQQIKALFAGFNNEINSILCRNDGGNNLKTNRCEIVIAEELSKHVIKSIPVVTCERDVKYWQLKLQEQRDNYETPSFENAGFKEIREYLVFDAVQKFVLLSSDASASNNSSHVEAMKLSVVELIENPDYYVMRVFQLLKKHLSVNELVEIFYIAEMKNRNIDTFKLVSCAKTMLNLKLKQIPFMNKEIEALRQAIEVNIRVSATATANDEATNDTHHLYLLAYLWLIGVFIKVNGRVDERFASGEIFEKMSRLYEERDFEGMISIQEELLEKPSCEQQQSSNGACSTTHKLIAQVTRKVSEDLKQLLRQNELVKIGVLVMRLFSIKQNFVEVDALAQRDCLSELLREDYEYQFEEARYLDSLDDYASACVIEQALASAVDFNDKSHVHALGDFEAEKKRLKEVKQRMIFRGFGGDNISAFSSFFEENSPFVDKITGFLATLESIVLSEVDGLSFEELRKLVEIKKHIENWLHMSFEKYFAAFSDFLIPIHFGLLLVKNFIGTILAKSKVTAAQISLVCGNVTTRLNEFSDVMWEKKNLYKLRNGDDILKNIRTNFESFDRTRGLKEFCQKILHVASSNLMTREEIDKEVEDEKRKLIKDTRQLERMIVDEYNREKKNLTDPEDDPLHREKQEIEQAFNAYSKDYVHLLHGDLTIQEKLELQSQQLQQQHTAASLADDEDREEVAMVDLPKKQLDGVKHRSQNCVIEILNIFDASRVADKNLIFADEASVLPATEEKKSKSIKQTTNMRDFSFAHRLEYIKLGLVNNARPQDNIDCLLEFAATFGSVSHNNMLTTCLPDDKNHTRKPLDTQAATFNVYSDVIPSENVRIFAPVMNLLASIRRLLHEVEIFEDHAVLQNIAILCDFTLEQAVLSTPLNKIITGLQFIAEKVDEWNISAPKQYSFVEELAPIINLLLNWRKLERKCWKFMLAGKDRDIENIDVAMFLKLRNVIVGLDGYKSKDREELFKLIDQYMRTALMGNFGLRLKALYFLAYCDVEIESRHLESIIQQVYKYYMQFYPQYASAVQENRMEHEKDCAEYVSLAGWESKNYLTLKATVDKFQSKVHRIVKRYGDFLILPVGRQIFEATRNQHLTENYEAFRVKFEKQFIDGNGDQSNDDNDGEGSSSSQLEHHLITYEPTADSDRIVQIGHKILVQSCVSIPKGSNPTLKAVASPDDLCVWMYKQQMIQHVFDRVRELQSPEVTRSMKSKAVQDLFKYLKSLGFTSYFMNTQAIMGDETQIFDLHSLQIDGLRPVSATVIEDIHAIEKAYYATLDKICVLRFNTQYHDDLTKNNIRRGTGFLIEYFYYMKRVYQSLDKLLNQSTDFITFVDNIQVASDERSSAATSEKSASQLIVMPGYTDVKKSIAEQMWDVIYLASEIKAACNYIPSAINLDIPSTVSACQAILNGLPNVFSGQLVAVTQIESLIASLNALSEKLKASCAKASKLGYKDIQVLIQRQFDAASAAVAVIQEKIQSILAQKVQESSSSSTRALDVGSQEKIVVDLQLLAQKLIKVVKGYKANLKQVLDEEQEEEQIVIEENESAVQTAEETDASQVEEEEKKQKQAIAVTAIDVTFIQNEERLLKKMTKLLGDFTEKMNSEYRSDILAGISSKAFSTVQQMLVLIALYTKNTLVYQLKSIRSQAKFMNLYSIILYNVVYKGFCQPRKEGEQEPGSDEDEDGKYEMSKGTGIGEGQGEQNVSKDIKNEEQLLGNKNEDEDENDEDDQMEEEQKNGKKEDDFEMENDFQGKTGKKDKKENEDDQNDDDDDDDDGEEHDGDEGLSDVDDDEIDFKMWQGEEEEEDGEQKDQKQNKKKDDVEFKTNKKPQDKNDQDDTAKDDEGDQKEEKDQRTLEDFEKTKKNKPEEINEQKQNPKDDEEEDDDEKKDEKPKEKKKNDDPFEKQDKDEKEGEEEEEYDGKEGEQLDPELMKQDAELDEEEELNDQHQDGGSQEGDLESDMEDVSGGNGDDMIDPLEQVSDFEEDEGEKEDLVDENKNLAMENDNMDVEEEDDQNGDEEEKDYPKDIKKNQQKKPVKQDKKFGVDGNDDHIQMDEEEANDDSEKEKKQEQAGLADDLEKDETSKQQQGGEEKQQEAKNNTNQFSLDFLQSIIEKTQANARDLKNFFKDLNVVSEQDAQKDQQQSAEQQDVTEEPKADDKMEYEAFNPQDNLSSDELKNLLATNVNANEQKNATNIPSEMQDEDAQKKDEQQNHQDLMPKKPEGEKQEPAAAAEQPKKQNADHKNKNQQQQQKGQNNEQSLDFMEEERKKAELKKQQELADGVNAQDDSKIQEEEEEDDAKNGEKGSKESQKPTDGEKMDVDGEDAEKEENEVDSLDWLESESAEDRKERMLKLIQECKNNPEKFQKGMSLWQKIENEARFFSVQLCEELKAVLEPTLIASFKGDYKSGKRLNMKKIIPYIASNFRKDKIWLRRNDPSKRTYQILLAIDDSLSMQQQNVGYFALQSMTILSLAMSKMEVGQIGIASIKNGLSLLHDFNTPLTPADSPFILSQFDFTHADADSSDLDLVRFMRSTIDMFKEAKAGSKETHQICFIMSDGRFNKKLVRPLVQEAEENNMLFVFIVLDKSDDKESIMNIKSTNHKYVNGKLQIEMIHYLEDFPYKNYIIVKDVHELSKVLVDILRQYYEMKKNM